MSQRRLVFAIVLIIVIAAGYSLVRDGPGSLALTPVPAAPAAWTPPSGFDLSTDPTIAYRWATSSEYDCEIADACWGMFVVPENGCPTSLYVELALTDTDGNAVGYTNDTAGSVTAGQQAKLVFDNFEDDAVKARLAKVSCY